MERERESKGAREGVYGQERWREGLEEDGWEGRKLCWRKMPGKMAYGKASWETRMRGKERV